MKLKCGKSKEKQKKNVVKKNKNKNSRYISTLGLGKTRTSLAAKGQYHIISDNTIMDIYIYKLMIS